VKSGSLNLLEPSGLLQTCLGIVLALCLKIGEKITVTAYIISIFCTEHAINMKKSCPDCGRPSSVEIQILE